MAVETLPLYYRLPLERITLLGLLVQVVAKAHQTINRAGRESIVRDGMATTLTVATISGDRMRLAHVGDSRAYQLRKGELKRLTRDHGRIPEGQKSRQPSRTLGAVPPLPQIDSTTVALEREDRILLCSDGVHDAVGDDEIRKILQTQATAAALARALIDCARAHKSERDVTALVAIVHETAI
jgi:serine/threonine protein phosphatase PrpC